VQFPAKAAQGLYHRPQFLRETPCRRRSIRMCWPPFARIVFFKFDVAIAVLAAARHISSLFALHGMLCVDEAEAFLHAAFADEFLDGVGDIEIIAPVRCFKPEMFGQGFHPSAMPSKRASRNLYSKSRQATGTNSDTQPLIQRAR